MAPEDVHKTAFMNPDVQSDFTRIPFGMVNFLGSCRLIQGSYMSLRQDFTINRSTEERKSRTYPVERGT